MKTYQMLREEVGKNIKYDIVHFPDDKKMDGGKLLGTYKLTDFAKVHTKAKKHSAKNDGSVYVNKVNTKTGKLLHVTEYRKGEVIKQPKKTAKKNPKRKLEENKNLDNKGKHIQDIKYTMVRTSNGPSKVTYTHSENDTHHITHMKDQKGETFTTKTNKKTGEVEKDWEYKKRPLEEMVIKESEDFLNENNIHGNRRTSQKITRIHQNTDNKGNNMGASPYHTNTREKETEDHFETHFDTTEHLGLVTRVHKKTGEITRNYHNEIHAGLFGGITNRYKKNKNGEFK